MKQKTRASFEAAYRGKNFKEAAKILRRALSKNDGRVNWHTFKKNFGASNSNVSQSRQAVAPGISDQLNSGFIENVEANISSVVMVVSESVILEAKGADTVLIWSEPLHRRKLSNTVATCPDTRFANSPSAFSLGTGFFVKNDAIATAAHVVAGRDVGALRFVHGIVAENDSDFEHHIIVHKSQVFRPVQLSGHLPDSNFELYSNGSDWAMLNIQPAYPDYIPLPGQPVPKPVRLPASSRLMHIGDPVYGIGHGLGLPLKISFDGDIQNLPDKTNNQHFFECSSTLLGGNSGSPVFFFDTHELAGLYMRGIKKLYPTEKNNCLLIENELNWVNGDYKGQECQSWETIWQNLGNIR